MLVVALDQGLDPSSPQDDLHALVFLAAPVGAAGDWNATPEARRLRRSTVYELGRGDRI